MFQALPVVYRNCNDSDSLIYGGACQHLCNFDWEYVWSIHDWANIRMDLILNEGLEAWNEVDVEPKHVSTNWFAHVVDVWLFQEAYFYFFNVGIWDLKLDFYPH